MGRWVRGWGEVGGGRDGEGEGDCGGTRGGAKVGLGQNPLVYNELISS